MSLSPITMHLRAASRLQSVRNAAVMLACAFCFQESVSDKAGREKKAVEEGKVYAIRRSTKAFDRVKFTSTKTAITSSEEKNPAASIIHLHTVACNGNAEKQRPTVA